MSAEAPALAAKCSNKSHTTFCEECFERVFACACLPAPVCNNTSAAKCAEAHTIGVNQPMSSNKQKNNSRKEPPPAVKVVRGAEAVKQLIEEEIFGKLKPIPALPARVKTDKNARSFEPCCPMSSMLRKVVEWPCRAAGWQLERLKTFSTKSTTTTSTTCSHREKDDPYAGTFAPTALYEELRESLAALRALSGPVPAMVTRLLDRKEMLSSAKALEAIKNEAKGLEDVDTWDLSTVEELDDIKVRAKEENEPIVIGQLMCICSEKFAEMEEACRVLKGRIVFRGDSARDEYGMAAIYQDLNASPTAITSANANIAYGLIPGNKTTSADAVKAYVQAMLKSKHPTYVELPRELQPVEWRGKYRRPVVRLRKSLYGHPEAGAHWQIHLEAILAGMGGNAVDGHMSTFIFADTKLMLTVYVDDLVLSGPESAHTPFWEEISKKVKLEEISGLGRFLGRYHEITMLNDKPALAFGMTDYIRSSCDLYESLPGSVKLKHASTPFVPDGSLSAEDDESRGALSENACRVLMKCLWVARLARPDILRPITLLATKVREWTKNCDKQLHRLFCYMHSTPDLKLIGQVADGAELLELALYVDADFAGDRTDAKSSSGGVFSPQRTKHVLSA